MKSGPQLKLKAPTNSPEKLIMRARSQFSPLIDFVADPDNDLVADDVGIQSAATL